MFEEVKALIVSCIDGYNVCIFAYGQTGSGKTFTMEVISLNCCAILEEKVVKPSSYFGLTQITRADASYQATAGLGI